MRLSAVFAFVASVIAVVSASCELGFPDKFPAVNVTFRQLVLMPQSYSGFRIRITDSTVVSLGGVLGGPSTVELGANGPSLGATVHVRSENDFLTFPLDCVGASAIVEGVFAISDPTALVMEITATAVVLDAAPSRTVCQKWSNQAREQDMTAGDLNTEYMGAGLVTLKPGQHMHLHSTNSSSEIVTVVQGQVAFVLMRGSVGEEHIVSAGHAIFIPHSTPHLVANRNSDVAVYVYVHAMVPTFPASIRRAHHLRKML